jgi:hypothetical protein
MGPGAISKTAESVPRMLANASFVVSSLFDGLNIPRIGNGVRLKRIYLFAVFTGFENQFCLG